MVIPAFVGWTHFRPPVPRLFPWWYLTYVSSPLGVGSGPLKIGWILTVIIAVAFVILGLTFTSPGMRFAVLRVSGMSFILALYVALGIGQESQFDHWVNRTSSCTMYRGNCIDHFIAPSGRALTIDNSAWSWGVGLGLLAVICGAMFVVGLSQMTEIGLRSGTESHASRDPLDNPR